MRILQNSKGNAGGRRLSTTLKAQPQAQPALFDLRKNLQERKDLETYVRQLITTADVTPVMETLSRVSERGPGTVTGWYTVNITKCAGLPDSTIYMALNWVMMPLQMEIFNFRRSGPADNSDCAEFLLDSALYAKRLIRLQEHVMVLYTCQPLEVRVKPGLPNIEAPVSEEFEKAVEEALRGRYNAATRTLDLSRFHADPRLSQHFCPLHVVKFLEGTLVVARRELQHEVTGIILSNNYLCSLKAFAAISAKDFTALQRIDISSNKINDLAELKHLSNLPIKTLLLSGNEVAKLQSDNIRKILPELKDIHGCVQSKPRAVLLVSLPKFQQLQDGGSGSFGLEFVQRFVMRYYESFDDPAERQQLVELYDTQATLSLSVAKHLNRVSVYSLYNRNHVSLHSSFARNGKLQVGSLALTQALGRFPRMLTGIQGANVDIMMFNNRRRIFTLTGSFKERTCWGWEHRLFQRTFVLHLPEGHTGWLITNDMLSIISPYVDQRVPFANVPLNVAFKREIIDPTVIIEISDSEEESTSAPASPKLVIDPVEQAVQELSLSMPKMALGTEAPGLEMLPPLEMPPLVEIPPEMLSTASPDLDQEYLDLDIDSTLLANDALDIDEEMLLGDI